MQVSPGALFDPIRIRALLIDGALHRMFKASDAPSDATGKAGWVKLGREPVADARCTLWSRPEIDRDAPDEAPIFAPALAALPVDSRLVMATLPVLDWNGLLLAALTELPTGGRQRTSAAVLMVDPFACWTDIADQLRERGFTSVANFPPASLCHGPAGSPDAFDSTEGDRIAWFESEGFQVVRLAVRDVQAGNRPAHSEAPPGGFILSPELLSARIRDGMVLPGAPY